MSVHPRAPAAARSQQGPSRLDAVLRSGQARRSAAALRTSTNPNLRPPMNITELPTELKQLVTKHLAASNAGDATSLCSDLQAWCRTHPVACEDPDVWRIAFLALLNWQDTIQEQREDPNPPPSSQESPEAAGSGPPMIWVSVPNPALEPTPFPYQTYKHAFMDACMRIDVVRSGYFVDIRCVHPALLESNAFMQHVAVFDARVIKFAGGMSFDVKEAMWARAIRANPRNLSRARIYHPMYQNPTDISEYEVVNIFHDQPEIIQYLPSDFELDHSLWNLEGTLRGDPLLLRYMTRFEYVTNDECLMLELARGDGRSLQYMSKVWRGNKRIVLAALRAGPDVYEYVEGDALRRDPDVRKAIGLKPIYKWPRVPRNRDEETPCDDSDDDSDDDEEEDHGGPSNFAASSDDEAESPTSTFDAIPRASNMDDSSSDEEDVTHDMDAANVLLDETEDWAEDASPPRSPVRGDYPPYDRQRRLMDAWSRVSRS